MDSYEIRPADEGWFSHETGQWIPRTTAGGQDTLQTPHGQGEGRVAYHNGEPVASVTWQETPTHIMLGSAYTHPDHRGQGLFNQLTEDVRNSGKPVDAYVWDNPWLKNKVRDWRTSATSLWSAWPKQAAGSPWYHLTERPDFALDPTHQPENNALTISPGDYPPGLFLTREPEHWYNGKDYVRPYVAEIHAPDDIDEGRWGHESFLPAERFGEAQVKRVMPYDAWAQEHYEGQPYAGPDARAMTPEQHQAILQQTNQYIRDQRSHMLSYPCSHCGGDNETYNECQSCGKREDPSLDAYQTRGYMPQFRGTGDFYKLGGLMGWSDPKGECPICGENNVIEDVDPSTGKMIRECVNCTTHWDPYVVPDAPHPDPWMDNEPGSLTMPKHWGTHLAAPVDPTMLMNAWSIYQNSIGQNNVPALRALHPEASDEQLRAALLQAQQMWFEGNSEGSPGPFQNDWVEQDIMEHPDYVPNIGEVEPKYGSMTLPQEQRLWESLQPLRSGRAETVHSFPNGWSVQDHVSYGDANAVGKFMHNCWQHSGNVPEVNLNDELYSRNPSPGSSQHLWYHQTLNDEYGMPRAAFYVQHRLHSRNPEPQILQALGQRNQELGPEHEQMLSEYANANGIGYTPKQRGQLPEGCTGQMDAMGGITHDGDVCPVHEAVDPYAGHQAATKRAMAETRTQRLRQAEEHELHYGPDTSEPVHEWPDGWTIRRLNTYADMMREGHLMGNCFSVDDSDTPHALWDEHHQTRDLVGPDDPNWDRYRHTDWSGISDFHPQISQSLYSLRDPDNLPHASIDPYTGDNDHNVMGRHNYSPKPEYMYRVHEWAKNASDPNVSEYAEDWHPTNYLQYSDPEAYAQWAQAHPELADPKAPIDPSQPDMRNQAHIYTRPTKMSKDEFDAHLMLTLSAQAVGQTYYHVAPQSARESIQTHGINTDHAYESPWGNYDNYDEGNYLWSSLPHAQWYADEQLSGPQDIWQVNPEGLEIGPDPSVSGGEAWAPYAHHTAQPIPAQALRHAYEWDGESWHERGPDQHTSASSLAHMPSGLAQDAVPPPQTPVITRTYSTAPTPQGYAPTQLTPPSPHLLVWQPTDGPGRGIVEGNGRIHTWPEDWGTHGQYAHASDLPRTGWAPFYLDADRATGQVRAHGPAMDYAPMAQHITNALSLPTQPVRFSRAPALSVVRRVQCSRCNRYSEVGRRGRTSRSPYCSFCDRGGQLGTQAPNREGSHNLGSHTAGPLSDGTDEQEPTRWETGGCGVLAHHIHEQTGWPIMGSAGPEEHAERASKPEWGSFPHYDHVFIRHPSGMALDARGLSPMPGDAEEVDPQHLRALFEAEAFKGWPADPEAGVEAHPDYSDGPEVARQLIERYPASRQAASLMMERMAMAERSGIPELDAAIEEFMAGPFKSTETTENDINAYREPQNAYGNCEIVANAFAEFLKQRGFKAYATSDEVGAFGYQNAPGADVEGEPWPEHAVVEVYATPSEDLGAATVLVDFTASQYGYTEFPKVEGGRLGSTMGPMSEDSPSCPNCGATDEWSGGLCYSCGYGSKPCPRCGNETQDGYCYSCGMDIPQEVSQEELGKPQCQNCGSTDLSGRDYPQPLYQCRACNGYTVLPGEGLNVERDVKVPIYSPMFDYGPPRQGSRKLSFTVRDIRELEPEGKYVFTHPQVLKAMQGPNARNWWKDVSVHPSEHFKHFTYSGQDDQGRHVLDFGAGGGMGRAVRYSPQQIQGWVDQGLVSHSVDPGPGVIEDLAQDTRMSHSEDEDDWGPDQNLFQSGDRVIVRPHTDHPFAGKQVEVYGPGAQLRIPGMYPKEYAGKIVYPVRSVENGRDIYASAPEDWLIHNPQPEDFSHPDPWMDSEPGSLTLPEHWGAVDPKLFDIVYRRITQAVGSHLTAPEAELDPQSFYFEMVADVWQEYAPADRPSKDDIAEAMEMAFKMVKDRQGEGPQNLENPYPSPGTTWQSPTFQDPQQHEWNEMPEQLGEQIPGWGGWSESPGGKKDAFPSYVGDPRFPGRMRWSHVPPEQELDPLRDDKECHFVAEEIADRWPHLQQEGGFYNHPERGPGDHGWNIAPDGTIVDMTAAQHDYDEQGLANRGWEEGQVIPKPVHPEVIPPDHPYYPRYISWDRHPQEAMDASFTMGVCPSCGNDTAIKPCDKCGYPAS